MLIPAWLTNQDNALLIIILLLLLWLWLLVSRRQEDNTITQRKVPLSENELGRAVFMSCLSNDLRGYRSLYLTAKEAHDKLGDLSEQYLTQRDASILEQSFDILCQSITVGCVYKGIKPKESGVLILEVQGSIGEISTVSIGSMTMVKNVYRLLSPA
jgi:hypothetical protein